MRSANRTSVIALAGVAMFLAGCSGTSSPRDPRASVDRQSLRAYAGAPPVIPHSVDSASCVECHGQRAVDVPDMGVAPPSPHGLTEGVGVRARCRQCHVAAVTDRVFVSSRFSGLVIAGGDNRAYGGAPPVIPHRLFMRENCAACHAGPTARPEVRTSHPERTHCTQCHVLAQGRQRFER